MNLVLEAARVAPTATNAQPQKIFVIESDEKLKKLAECTPCTYDAPAAILVCYDTEKSWKRSDFDNEDSGVIDAAIIGTHIMLQAAEIGLGTTWVGYFDPEKVSKLLELPKKIVPAALFPIGYPAADAEPSEEYFLRNEISETVQFV